MMYEVMEMKQQLIQNHLIRIQTETKPINMCRWPHDIQTHANGSYNCIK